MTMRFLWSRRRRLAAILLMITGWVVFFLGRFEWSALCFMWGWLLDTEEQPSLRPNQAVVTAPIEPSALHREWAHSVMQMRAALINEGMSPDQATKALAEMIAAQSRGDS